MHPFFLATISTITFCESMCRYFYSSIFTFKTYVFCPYHSVASNGDKLRDIQISNYLKIFQL
jgi:hypothetical protein